ncbi:hypothetical protein [Ferrovum sp.]|uniref:hypothetical protein n=1 Tax=Ferrovum sp. TaxID=2609467 RepID=UPI002613DB3C|nr:hypothetical protein [Ferrovum sp.]
METPTLDEFGSPTDETLETIARWPMRKDGNWSELARFCVDAWNTQYGSISESKVGKTRLIAFVTGGWSDNEAILSAMCCNQLFYLSAWHSTERGGLVRFLV